ncbi:DUF1661 domain-containing protein [Porphyromonas gingivalis]|uniref:DUF1661 domain-containing protein n=1 Tax=Porphyromonas gingivalis TaxID=837 RepID=UPI001E354277|nr:DUF1661 domain-containing protein [Porphyromonas gingivalis]USI94055.1 DUF1661 domain-containing protein [Porphyromonas gingivalis]USI95941.1 DUF1661 domain-containing protein [Porphyromonas gingivalis]USI97852.1 DUF1661 domain-containing protein [Porphyromonas gingivalis]WCG01147.1 DUF1661 domain-containing protein [Porphyromonas gingivalis]
MARKIFASRTKTKKFSRHLFQYTSLRKKTFPAGTIISFYSLLYFVLLGLLRL